MYLIIRYATRCQNFALSKILTNFDNFRYDQNFDTVESRIFDRKNGYFVIKIVIEKSVAWKNN